MKNFSTLYTPYYIRNSITTAQNGYGGILYYDLRKTDVSNILSIIGTNAVGQEVVYDGVSYERDWSWGPTTDY